MKNPPAQDTNQKGAAAMDEQQKPCRSRWQLHRCFRAVGHKGAHICRCGDDAINLDKEARS